MAQVMPVVGSPVVSPCSRDRSLWRRGAILAGWSFGFGLAILAPAMPAFAVCDGGLPDGDVGPTEVCDDGNLVDGDGCDGTCTIESGFVCKIPIDFSGGVTIEDYDVVGGGIAADWTIIDRYSATQANNTEEPTIGLVGAEATEYVYIIDITVETTEDNDFIGFVLGFSPGESTDANPDYLLIDWKQGNQSVGGGSAARGLALSQVTAVPNDEFDFWLHDDAVTELDRGATLGGTAWGDNTTHRFAITYSTNSLIITVDGVEQFNAVPADYSLAQFPDGQIGFYGLSQRDVNYTVYSPRASVCNEEPIINVDDLEVWTVTGTSPFDVDVASIIDFTDPDDDGIDGDSLIVVTPPAGATVEDPSDPGIPSGTLRITPDVPSSAIDYAIGIEICDDDPVIPGCDTATVTIRYNDPPTIGAQTDSVLPSATTTITGENIVADDDTTQGTQDPGWDISSLSVSTTLGGAYGTSAPSLLGGTCEIVNEDVQYTAPAGQAGNTDSCFVQLCESEPGPAGLPAPGRACGIVEFTFSNVECFGAGDCTAAAPVCTANACVGCTANGECAGHAGLPACTGDGSCGQCNATEDSECTGASACNVTTNLCEGDADGDGVPDSLDADTDNDGTPDAVEGTDDSDGDGIPDNFDLDSDNDGIPDLTENGGSALDADNDGRIDGIGQPGFDEDGDGLADTIDADPDNDNVITSTLELVNSDDDAVPDYLDLDSDADGIPDVVEAGGADAGDGRIATVIDDANGDGLHDPLATTPLALPDTDSNGTFDFQDNDDDGDGVPTADELGTGGASDPRDTNADDVPDYLDVDDDGDGVSTVDELGSGGAENPRDSDGNGVPDFLDDDDDGDGIPTADELGDADGDGVPDYLQTDSTTTGTNGVAGGGGFGICAIDAAPVGASWPLWLVFVTLLSRRRRLRDLIES